MGVHLLHLDTQHFFACIRLWAGNIPDYTTQFLYLNLPFQLLHRAGGQNIVRKDSEEKEFFVHEEEAQ